MKKLVPFVAIAGMICLGSAAQAGTICPRIFKPVCGDRHGSFKTYPNACVAHAAHARVIANCSCAVGR